MVLSQQQFPCTHRHDLHLHQIEFTKGAICEEVQWLHVFCCRGKHDLHTQRQKRLGLDGLNRARARGIDPCFDGKYLPVKHKKRPHYEYFVPKTQYSVKK